MNDLDIMKMVLKLAQKGEGFTSPNPMVGAAITKGGKVISTGFHRKAGLPHAEIEAINKAKDNLRGARLFVNLEPCCFWGKTPPCVDRIISSGVKEVVFSTLDPNPRVNGKSLRKLRKNGIKVKVGLLRKEAKILNEIFFKNMEEKRAFVVLKVAQSLDGKIATRRGVSMWITSSKARYYAKKLRDKYDAVLVGVNTVKKDNPHLKGAISNPYKIILDPFLDIPLQCGLVKDSADKLIIFSFGTNGIKNKRKMGILKSRGVKIFSVNAEKDRLSLKKVVSILYEFGIMSVYVEGGSFTLGSFFDERLVDKIYLFVASKIIGGSKALSSVGASGVAYPDNAAIIKDINIDKIGKDLLITGYPGFKNAKQRKR